MPDTKKGPRLSPAQADALRVIVKNDGNTIVGRFNDSLIGTVHHNSLKGLQAAGLVDVKTTKAGVKIKTTAAGRKEAKARGITA